MKQSDTLTNIIEKTGFEPETVLSVLDLTSNAEDVSHFIYEMFSKQNNNAIYIDGQAGLGFSDMHGRTQSLFFDNLNYLMLRYISNGRGYIDSSLGNVSVAFTVGMHYKDDWKLMRDDVELIPEKDKTKIELKRRKVSGERAGECHIEFHKNTPIYGIARVDRDTVEHIKYKRQIALLENQGFNITQEPSKNYTTSHLAEYMGENHERGIQFLVDGLSNSAVRVKMTFANAGQGEGAIQRWTAMRQPEATSYGKDKQNMNTYSFVVRNENVYESIRRVIEAYDALGKTVEEKGE